MNTISLRWFDTQSMPNTMPAVSFLLLSVCLPKVIPWSKDHFFARVMVSNLWLYVGISIKNKNRKTLTLDGARRSKCIDINEDEEMIQRNISFGSEMRRVVCS